MSIEATSNDIKMMILAEVHISSEKIEPQMKQYIYGKIKENYKEKYIGCCLFNLKTTWDKIILAARIISSIEDTKSIYCVGQDILSQRAIIKFSKEIGATPKPGRFTPGQFTNQVTKSFVEPRLLIVANPNLDSQAIKEASYVNIPVIGFCGSDSKLDFIDVAIPGNNCGRESIGLLYWLLVREVKRIKEEIPRENIENDLWAHKVPVDLFFHREIEEIEKEVAKKLKKDVEVEEKTYNDKMFQNENSTPSNEEISKQQLNTLTSNIPEIDINTERKQPQYDQNINNQDWENSLKKEIIQQSPKNFSLDDWDN